MGTVSNSSKNMIELVRGWLDKGSSGGLNRDSDSELVGIVRRLLGPDPPRPDQLQSLLEREQTLCARMINAANRVDFNPAGVPVNRLPEALETIGIKRHHRLATALALQEYIERATAPAFRHEVAAFCMCTAWMAEAVARHDPDSRGDSAFFPTLLHEYGHCLLASCAALMEGDSEEDTESIFSNRLEVDPLAIGVQLVCAGQLPPLLNSCLKTVGTPPDRRPDRVSSVAEFCELQTLAILHAKRTAEALDPAAAGRADPLHPAPRFGVEDFITILRYIEAEMATLAGDSAKSLLHTDTYRRVRLKSAGANPSRGRPSKKQTFAPFGTGQASLSRDTCGGDTFLNGIFQLTQLLSEPPFLLEQAFGIFIQTVYEGLHLNDVVLFTRRSNESGLRANHGIGELFQVLDWREPLKEDKKDVFGICLYRREEVWIPDTNDPGLSGFLPEWVHQCGHVHSLVLLPVEDEDRPFALLFGVRRSNEPLAVNMKVLQLLKAMRIHLVTIRRLAGS